MSTETPSLVRGRPRSEASRGAIIAAATQLLRSVGLHRMTVEAVAELSGVGKATIYRWWPSKGAVVADALARHAGVVVPERDSGSFTGDLAAFLIDSFAGLENAGYAERLRQIVADLGAEGGGHPRSAPGHREAGVVQQLGGPGRRPSGLAKARPD